MTARAPLVRLFIDRCRFNHEEEASIIVEALQRDLRHLGQRGHSIEGGIGFAGKCLGQLRLALPVLDTHRPGAVFAAPFHRHRIV
jgi:hypothetical protein